MVNRWGNWYTLFSWAPKSLQQGLQSGNSKMLAPWKKSHNKPRQGIKKQRHHFADKDPYSEIYGFSSGHVWSESWTVKKAECWRIDAFELWCWRRLLRVPWTAKRAKQSILKEIISEYLLEGLMLKLKLQYFGHLMRRTDTLEKTLMLGKVEGGRRRGWQRMRWLDGFLVVVVLERCFIFVLYVYVCINICIFDIMFLFTDFKWKSFVIFF